MGVASVLEAATISALLLIGFHYVGYPALIWALARLRSRRPARGAALPRVSIVIAAHNEGAIIGRKIEATLALDYPDLEIIVVSDGSTDATVSTVRGFAPSGVTLVEIADRGGKGRALNAAVAQAGGEIVLISDANAFPAPDAVRKLVRHFADPEVGMVSGRVAPDPASAGASAVAGSEGLYWRYESVIKQAESDLGSATGVVGSLLAIRRQLYDPVPDGVINDDSHLMLATMRQGYRVIYEPDALALRHASRTTADELARRQRMAAGRFQHLLRLRAWPWGNPMAVFCLFCHKFLRLLLPILMIVALAANAARVALPPVPPLLVVTLAGQVAVYALALGGYALERRGRRNRLAMLAYYVVTGNLGMLLGLVRYVSGRQSVLWRKAER
jgi:poly-beta-1,6-N-acetyl-D-glucosamine synthase